MVEVPEVLEPVEPLVPELLDVPAEPLLDGDVVVELPVDPMLDVEPELDDGIDDEELDDGIVEELDDGAVLVDLPLEPMPDVVPEVDEPVVPMVDEPLLVPEVDGRDCVAVDDDEGLVEPVAEPPAAPMPEAEPLAVPVELQAAREAAQAAARINLCIRISLCNDRRAGAAPGSHEVAPPGSVQDGQTHAASRETRPSRRVGRWRTQAQRVASRVRSLRSTPSGPNSSTSSAWPGRTGWDR